MKRGTVTFDPVSLSTYCAAMRAELMARAKPLPGAVHDALIVELSGVPPVGIGDPLVTIEGYTTVPQTRSAGTYRFAFSSTVDSSYLRASKGQSIPGRSVVLPGIDVLDRHDALASASIERNRFLVDQRKSADAFVYTTGQVEFPGPLHPYVDRSDAVNIAGMGSSTPVSRSLTDHLDALFKALLFDGNQPKADELTFQVETTYSYPINAMLAADPIPLPVFMQPPMTVSLGTGGNGGGTLDDMRAAWVSAISGWFSQKLPLAGGQLTVDLTIMTNLTQNPLPLLRLRGLYLPVCDIDPPLATRPDPWSTPPVAVAAG
jgi:hypothetical protein